MENNTATMEHKHTIKDFANFKGLLTFVKPYWKMFALIIFLDIFVNAGFNLEPLISKALVDYLAGVGENPDVSKGMLTITFFVILDVLVYGAASAGGFFVSLALKKQGQKVVKDMRNAMFEHIMSFSQKQLRELKIGSYVTRVTNDTQTISSLFSDILPQLLRAFLSLVIIIVTTFIVTTHDGVFYFGFLFLAYLPLIFVISYFFRRKAKHFYRMEKKSVSEMNSFLSETFQGIKVIKTFEKGEKKGKEFDQKNDDIYHSFLNSQRLFAIFLPLMYFLQITCVVLVILLCIPNIRTEGAMVGITIGTFQMVYSYSNQFFQPIQTITNSLNQIESIFTSSERVLLVLNQEIELVDKENPIEVDHFQGKVEFRNVTFSYEKGNPVLNNVSFVIQPGQTAAFVGATGAGKSTIISLLCRTYEIDSGEILIDDINIQDYSIDCLRRNIGVMLQDVFLFSGTIESNISLGENIPLDEIQKACVEVGADKMITQLEDGYQTKVKEKGANFSAGERQLISFARTLVYHPSMVLLDEATANIDTETEHIIQSSLERIKQIGTLIIVAHRLSTIKNADVIFVVDKGVIKEHGTHQELLKLHQIYYNLYRLQNMERNLGKEDLQDENDHII